MTSKTAIIPENLIRGILAKIGSVVLLFLFLFSSQTHAQFSVTGTTPAANALDVTLNSDITISFSANVDAATVSSSTIIIRSEQQGAVAGSFSVNGSTVTFSPAENFRAGDLIFATVTTEVSNTMAEALDNPYIFSFNTEVLSPPESPPFFVDETVSTLAGSSRSVIAADLDGDGDLDLASASPSDDKIAWYENTNGTGNFGSQQVVSTAVDGAFQVTAADIDGDGDLDLASASVNDNTIAWYENTDGNGNFGSQQVVSTAADGASSVTAADIDGDGDLDLASASSADAEIAWYENIDGNGNFGTQQIVFAFAFEAKFVIAADLDGDGDMDLASASSQDDTIAWYENTHGTGTFGPQQVVTDFADFAWEVKAADIDGDEDLDLVSVSSGEPLSSNDGEIAWYENTGGNDSFETQHIITNSADGAISVSVADFDGDGDMDVASASNADDTISWYENTNEIGNFGPAQEISTAADGPGSVTAADLDGDGDLDLASASTEDDKIAWYENTASLKIVSLNPDFYQLDVPTDGSIQIEFNEAIDGTTLDGTSINITGNQTGTIGGTFSGGGTNTVSFDPMENFFPGERISITIKTSLSSTAGHILENPVSYQFTTQVDPAPESPPVFTEDILSTNASSARTVETADLDGDGDLDLISGSSLDDKIAWYENTDGSGSFGSEQIISFNTILVHYIKAADIDGDGDLDLFSHRPFIWYENMDGSGMSWIQHDIPVDAGANHGKIADIDNDGDLDVVASVFRTDGSFIAWYPNNGSGSFGAGQAVATAGSSELSVGDIDGDGDLDLASIRGTNTFTWYENIKGGNSWTEHTISSSAEADYYLTLADLDGDGDLDVISTYNLAITSDQVSISWFENLDGNGNFGPQRTIFSSNFAVEFVLAGDLDGDGDLDLASASFSEATIAWYENTNGNGSFGPQQIISITADGATFLDTGDFDGDGDLDLASASAEDNAIAWYENIDNTDPVITAGQEFTVPEATEQGDLVGTVEVIDASSLSTWHFRAGNTDRDADGNPPFAINSNSSDLVVNDTDDITFSSGAQIYDLNLMVEDSDGNLSDSTHVSIKVGANNVHIFGTGGFDGWRFLGTPSTSQSYSSLLTQVWTQGAAGASTTSGTPNVMQWDESSQQFVSVTDLTQTIPNSKGFIAYLYEDDDPETPEVDGGWPKELNVSGTAESGIVSFPLSYSNGPNPSLDGFNLVANPYAISIDWEHVGWTKTNINDAIYIWDPNANGGSGEYKQRVGGVGDPINVIPPFQAFWVQANAPDPVLGVTEKVLVDGGSFLKENPAKNTGVITLKLSSEKFQDKMYLSFRPEGEHEKDPYDALQLASLSGRFLELYSHDPEGTPFAIQSLPRELNKIKEIPLSVNATTSGRATLSWEQPKNLPENWHFSLKDKKTGQIVILNQPGTYSFDLAENSQHFSKQGTVSDSNPLNAKLKTTDSGSESSRFLLRINPGLEGFAEESTLPRKTELAQNYPNPFNPETVIRYGVPEQAEVRLTVYDMLGRRVQTLINEQKSAGRYEASFNASELASGLYIYRLKVGTNVLTKKMMLIK